jgi:uncharacterized protein (TIGR03067 family)
MATRWRGMVLAMVLGLVAGSRLSADQEKAVSGDLKKLQGTWVSTENSNFESRWVFEGDTLKATVNGDEYETKVSLNPKAKPEATIDFKITKGPGDSEGQTSLGIYKFDGDKLLICTSHPGRTTRPTKFETIEEEQSSFELKKAK